MLEEQAEKTGDNTGFLAATDYCVLELSDFIITEDSPSSTG